MMPTTTQCGSQNPKQKTQRQPKLTHLKTKSISFLQKPQNNYMASATVLKRIPMADEQGSDAENDHTLANRTELHDFLYNESTNIKQQQSASFNLDNCQKMRAQTSQYQTLQTHLAGTQACRNSV